MLGNGVGLVDWRWYIIIFWLGNSVSLLEVFYFFNWVGFLKGSFGWSKIGKGIKYIVNGLERDRVFEYCEKENDNKWNSL